MIIVCYLFAKFIHNTFCEMCWYTFNITKMKFQNKHNWNMFLRHFMYYKCIARLIIFINWCITFNPLNRCFVSATVYAPLYWQFIYIFIYIIYVYLFLLYICLYIFSFIPLIEMHLKHEVSLLKLCVLNWFIWWKKCYFAFLIMKE